MITATVTSEYTSSERQLNPEHTIETLQKKLETITGIPPSAQKWLLSLPSGNVINANFEPGQKLKDCIPEAINNVSLRVDDTRPPKDQFIIDESIEKYEMSDSAYEQRTDSVLEWKKKNNLGRFAPGSQEPEREVVSAAVGDRTAVCLKSGKAPNGTIKFVGQVPEIPGNHIWVGVSLDLPEGKNDGSVKGKQYFKCDPQHGVFVRSSALVTEVLESDDEI